MWPDGAVSGHLLKSAFWILYWSCCLLLRIMYGEVSPCGCGCSAGEAHIIEQHGAVLTDLAVADCVRRGRCRSGPKNQHDPQTMGFEVDSCMDAIPV